MKAEEPLPTALNHESALGSDRAAETFSTTEIFRRVKALQEKKKTQQDLDSMPVVQINCDSIPVKENGKEEATDKSAENTAAEGEICCAANTVVEGKTATTTIEEACLFVETSVFDNAPVILAVEEATTSNITENEDVIVPATAIVEGAPVKTLEIIDHSSASVSPTELVGAGDCVEMPVIPETGEETQVNNSTSNDDGE